MNSQEKPAWSGSAPNPATSLALGCVHNIGNHIPFQVTEVVRLIEEQPGMLTTRELLPMQPGDVPEPGSYVSDLEATVGFKPATSIAVGIGRSVAWYRDYVAGRRPLR